MEEWQEVIKYRTTPTWIYVHGIRNNMYMTVMYMNTTRVQTSKYMYILLLLPCTTSTYTSLPLLIAHIMGGHPELLTCVSSCFFFFFFFFFFWPNFGPAAAGPAAPPATALPSVYYRGYLVIGENLLTGKYGNTFTALYKINMLCFTETYFIAKTCASVL